MAARRLRSDLRTFRGLLDADWTATLRDELRWLGAELGTVRDTEVLIERLQGRLETLPAEDRADAAPLLARLRERWEACRAELLAALRSPRYIAAPRPPRPRRTRARAAPGGGRAGRGGAAAARRRAVAPSPRRRRGPRRRARRRGAARDPDPGQALSLRRRGGRAGRGQAGP